MAIAVTAKTAKKYGDLARQNHPMLDASVSIERVIWNHSNKTTIEVTIWCSICGKFYKTVGEFNEAHGGE